MQPKHLPFVLTVGLLYAQTAVNAAPQAKIGTPLLSAATVAKDSPGQFERFAKLSAAAYCDGLYDGKNGTLVCASDSSPCSNLQGLKTVVELEGESMFSIAGYLAHDEKNNELVVAFRGTYSFYNTVLNLFKRQTNGTEVCGEECYIHYGFLQAWSNLKKHVEERIDHFRDERKGIRVVMTGHSLGGAVATLMTVYLRRNGIPCDLYTYGAPRVGDAKFVSAFANAQLVKGQEMGFTARITQRADVVPAIPPIACGYEHIFPEFWYKHGINTTKVPTPFDTSLRERGPGGCVDASTCTSANCAGGWLGLLSCSLEDHGSGTYAAGAIPCPGLSGRLLPDTPLDMDELKRRSEALQSIVDAKGPVISPEELKQGLPPAAPTNLPVVGANPPIVANPPTVANPPSSTWPPRQPYRCILIPNWCQTCCGLYPYCCRY